MKKIIFLTAIAMAFTFASCTDDGINNSIDGNVVVVQSAPAIKVGEMGFYLVGGNGTVLENTRITISYATDPNASQQRHTAGENREDPEWRVWCEGPGSGCTPTVVVVADRLTPQIQEAFAQLDKAIEDDEVDEFFEEENKDNYELIFELTDRDLFHLRNRIITLGKDVKAENRFAYYVIYTDDHTKIYR